MEIVERRCGVRKLANPLIKLALAPPDAAKVEAEDRIAEAVKNVVELIHHFVVHRPAELRMRVKHNRDGRVFLSLRVITTFQPAFGAGKNYFGHVIPSSMSRGPEIFLTNFLKHLRIILISSRGRIGLQAR